MKKANLLQDSYPGRLGCMYILHVNWFYRMIYGLVKPFLAKKTREKVYIVLLLLKYFRLKLCLKLLILKIILMMIACLWNMEEQVTFSQNLLLMMSISVLNLNIFKSTIICLFVKSSIYQANFKRKKNLCLKHQNFYTYF